MRNVEVTIASNVLRGGKFSKLVGQSVRNRVWPHTGAHPDFVWMFAVYGQIRMELRGWV